LLPLLSLLQSGTTPWSLLIFHGCTILIRLSLGVDFSSSA
jgi:hypothetical protein